MPRPSDSSDQRGPGSPAQIGANAAVRMAVGLAHTVPGAELTVRRPGGACLVAANRPGADLDLCALRRLVMSAMARATADGWLEVVSLGGAVSSTAEGLLASDGPQPQRWFATLIGQERIVDLLREIDTTDVGDDGIEVVLKPDPCLGMTAVGVTAQGPHLTECLDELARRASSACFIDELIWSARAEALRADRPTGRANEARPGHTNKGETT